MLSREGAACPACGAAASPPLLARRDVPVHQNLLCATRDEARRVGRGDVELRACPRCGLAFNAVFDPGRLSYAGEYDSDQSHSAAFLRHVDERVDALRRDGVRGLRVVEAGCGGGYFLRRLCERGGNSGTGYDPSYRGEGSDGGPRFVRGLFEAARDGAGVDVVLARHVIEHVRDPAGFVRALSAGLGDGASVYVETPALDWILEHTVVFDVFYEHCNYFSPVALRNVVRLGGLREPSVEPVFGGQYLWLRARVEAAAGEPALEPPAPADALRAFARRCDAAVARLGEQARRLADAGALAVWGAAAKGATFVNLVDPEAALVRCLVDVNPARQGRFVAGSGHAIVAPEELPRLGVADVIVMNPNYAGEVRAHLAQLGLPARVHLAQDAARAGAAPAGGA